MTATATAKRAKETVETAAPAVAAEPAPPIVAVVPPPSIITTE